MPVTSPWRGCPADESVKGAIRISWDAEISEF